MKTKKFKVISILILLFGVMEMSSARQTERKIEIASHAISKMIENLHEQSSMRFKLIFSMKDPISRRVADKLLKLSSAVIKIENHIGNSAYSAQMEESYVVLDSSAARSGQKINIEYNEQVYEYIYI